MAELETVLHKPTLPPNIERWHIILKGRPNKLFHALAEIAVFQQGVILDAEMLDDDTLLICLKWIDDVIPKFIPGDVARVSDDVTIKYNGRAICHGHNL
jgi:hypothetical protein